MKEIGCKSAWPVHISPLFWAIERLLPCKIVKICPRPAEFSLRFFKSDRLLAQRYRDLTGKPLGVTGEVAEYEAARILGISLSPARQAGYDATEIRNGKIFRLQIKGRCVLEGSKPGQRIGSIDINKEFDAVLLVLLDGNFEATAIYEAPRNAVIAALTKPGSKSRNERGALGISKFKSISHIRWQQELV